ncbi:unnamed protein product [Blepharisma stoltei]|uniref:RING-type domain-containing protein n=1 Tax=Blepharisma stoltei TaxID=1481888 RepID=A0AAU9IDJ8_9CILI|nr:unnamed protein product [Blepharisma stoltei]
MMNSFPRIPEVDEFNTSERIDNGERLQTEYAEEDTEEQLLCIKQELKRWIELAIALMFSFIILATYENLKLPIELALIPLMILDIKTLSFKITLFKRTELIPIRKDYLKDILEAFSSICFKILLIIWNQTKEIPFFATTIPLGVSLVLQIFFKSLTVHECQSFSKMFFFVGRWFRFFSLLTIGLKLDGYLNWGWIETLWPIWISLCFMGLISLGVLLLLLGAVLSYLSRETKIEEVLASLWLLFTTAGSTSSTSMFFMCLISILNDDPVMSISEISLFPLFFLLVFIISTSLCRNILSIWWKAFFTSNIEVIGAVPSNLDGRPLPLPESQARMARNQSLSHRIINVMQTTPRVLIRKTSTYFQPAEHPIELSKLKHVRTRSAKFDNINSDICFQNLENNRHKRAASTNVKDIKKITLGKENSGLIPRHSSDMSFANKTCVMCCENLCNAVLMDCGHGGLCYECSLKLWKNQGICHMCRNEINQVLQIEIEPSKVLKVLSTTRAVYEESDNEPNITQNNN